MLNQMNAPQKNMDQQIISERIRAFPAICRNSGLKVTHQRTAIYAMLAATDSHPSPEEVYTQIRGDLPSISLATVYKVLDLFNRYGFLRKVSTEGQVARYDANVRPHHHQICTSCGQIHDIEPVISPEQMASTKSNGFKVSHMDIIFHGTCHDCNTTGRAAN